MLGFFLLDVFGQGADEAWLQWAQHVSTSSCQCTCVPMNVHIMTYTCIHIFIYIIPVHLLYMYMYIHMCREIWQTLLSINVKSIIHVHVPALITYCHRSFSIISVVEYIYTMYFIGCDRKVSLLKSSLISRWSWTQTRYLGDSEHPVYTNIVLQMYIYIVHVLYMMAHTEWYWELWRLAVTWWP